MRPLRFVALGDSLTEGMGDPVPPGGRRGWAALLAAGLGTPAAPAEFHNLARGGARTADVAERQAPAALALRPDVATVLVGVNDTLRRSYDIHAVAAGLGSVYGAFAARGTVVVTACLPDPGTMLGLPAVLGRPLARRQAAVNAVVHALSDHHGALHVHMAEGAWLRDRAMWSADRLHPGERGHRLLAREVHALLAAEGIARGPVPSAEPDMPPPTRAAELRWLATQGTGWVARRARDLLPQLLALAAREAGHRARGTSAGLDARAAGAVASALAALAARHEPPVARGATTPRLPQPPSQGQPVPVATKRTEVPGAA
ncbi:SGNH/GDSL hydrolase family protein [Streptomyces sp. NPDC050560]|uniref:SGNH/GDSL hydrolase family protein n=1 Tax=Streptomyces sp. NPDC050560 TaxID=3365630 RepID=UPI00378B1E4F